MKEIIISILKEVVFKLKTLVDKQCDLYCFKIAKQEVVLEEICKK